jgi:hypothetical protein
VQWKEHSGIEFEGSRNGLLYLEASVVKYDMLDRVYYLEERRREVVENWSSPGLPHLCKKIVEILLLISSIVAPAPDEVSLVVQGWC